MRTVQDSRFLTTGGLTIRAGSLARACLLLAAAFVWQSLDCRAESLSVMSFNVRFDVGNDPGGSNGWYDSMNPSSARRLKVMSVIDTFAPDILGIQEARLHQIEDLSGQHIAGQGLLDYDHFAVDRGNGEYSPIFYRRDRFTPIDQGAFWISNTPDVPGSIYPGAAHPRVATWLVLEDAMTRQQYFVLNTHLDHVSAPSRNFGGQLIQAKLQELSGGLPILVMGDFNDNEFSWTLRPLTAPFNSTDITLMDPYRQIYPTFTANEATFHAYNGRTTGARIDFVLGTSEFVPQSAGIIHTSFDGLYPSDHFPVVATYQIARIPEPSTLAMGGIAAVFLAFHLKRLTPARARRTGRGRDG